ncbi:MAG: alpha/beta hydrolase, partial [Flavobacteriaceae bacterium]|nr:alpha/beta hydrolase [Flavobacteriaceae bacterium]
MKNYSLLYFSIFQIVLFLGCNSIEENGLFFKETGDGETIVFVHGSQEDYRVFMPQLELLGSDFHVITYSRRYNYPNKQENNTRTPFNPLTEAEDLEKLRKEVGIEKFNVVGHSYG